MPASAVRLQRQALAKAARSCQLHLRPDGEDVALTRFGHQVRVRTRTGAGGSPCWFLDTDEGWQEVGPVGQEGAVAREADRVVKERASAHQARLARLARPAPAEEPAPTAPSPSATTHETSP
ncbi:hypothetical protein ABZ234_08560 [Nocardiopsis sp. NPDC006198]|uniref:hypothetical protein n=1 Tax=Nocardiopsis sp. NPDC006198 TaxID=3154472 RepID=UPI0033BEB813